MKRTAKKLSAFLVSLTCILCSLTSIAQTVPVYADTTSYRGRSAGNEIQIRNSTKTTKGFLYNYDAAGNTMFKLGIMGITVNRDTINWMLSDSSEHSQNITGFINDQFTTQQNAKAWYDSMRVNHARTGNYFVDAPAFSRQTPYNSYVAFGNSITHQYYASSTQKAYAYLIGQHVQIPTVDKGVPGDQAADQQDSIYPTIVGANNQLYTIMVGSNDVTKYGTNTDKQTNFQLFALADAAYLCIPDTFKIKGQSAKATYTGTWSDATSYYGGRISKQSNTNGDNISFSLSGTTLYIAYTMLDGNTGTANVVIDGGAAIPITCYGTAGTAVLTGNGQTYGSACLRVAGLSAGSHTVSITVTSSTSSSNQVIFDWAAGNAFAPMTDGPTVIEGQVPFRFTQSGFSSYNPLVDSNVARLKRDGLNIWEAFTENSIPIPSGIAGDGAHPNDIGHAALYNAYRWVIDSLAGISGALQYNIPARYGLPSTYASSGLGSNIVTGSGWTSTGWTGDFVNGWTHTAGNIDTLLYPVPLIAGNNYHITFGSNSTSGGSCVVMMANTFVTTITGAGLTTVTVNPTRSGNLIFIPTTDFTKTIRNISVQQVTNQLPPVITVDIDSIRATEIRVGANDNFAIGRGAMTNITSGIFNQAFGVQAGASIANGSGNILMGYKTGRRLFDGQYNTGIGDQVLSTNTSGDYNVAIGYRSMFNGTSSHNVGIGVYALYNVTTGFYNFASVYRSLYDNTSGSYNIAIGYQAAQSNVGANHNIALGYNSLSSNISGVSNVAIGYQTLMNTTTGYSVAIGNAALQSSTTGLYNNAIGNFALSSNTTGGNNEAIGYNTLAANTTGNFNQAIGTYALQANTTGEYNNSIGNMALTANTTGSNNNAFGKNALAANKTGGNNTAIGYYALSSDTSGSHNIAIGNSALLNNISANYNIGIGINALSNTTGLGNIGIGRDAGTAITSGTNNVVIGYQSAVPLATTNGQLSIQNIIYGIANNGTSSTVSTGFIGIGVATPTSKLHVVPGAASGTTIGGKTINEGVVVDLTNARTGFLVNSTGSTLNSASGNAAFNVVFPFAYSSSNNDRTWKAFRLQTGTSLTDQFSVNAYGGAYFADTVNAANRLLIGNTAAAATGDSVLFKDPTTKVVKGAALGTSLALTGGVLDLSSTAISANYIVRETPSGTINSSNVTFTLANTPITGKEMVFLNGILQEAGGGDYSISGVTITFTSAPPTGSKLVVTYLK